MADTTDDDGDEDEGDEYTHAERLFFFLREWGMVEFMLDQCNAILFRKYERRDPRPEFPVTLERKLSYLVGAHAAFPELEPFRELARSIDAKFTSEKDLRNTIVHGIPLKYEENGTVHFLQLRKSKHGPRYTYREVTPRDWDRLHTVSAYLLGHVLMMTIALEPISEDSPLHHSKQPSREVMVELARGLPIPKRARNLVEKFYAGRPSD